MKITPAQSDDFSNQLDAERGTENFDFALKNVMLRFYLPTETISINIDL